MTQTSLSTYSRFLKSSEKVRAAPRKDFRSSCRVDSSRACIGETRTIRYYVKCYRWKTS